MAEGARHRLRARAGPAVRRAHRHRHHRVRRDAAYRDPGRGARDRNISCDSTGAGLAGSAAVGQPQRHGRQGGAGSLSGARWRCGRCGARAGIRPAWQHGSPIVEGSSRLLAREEPFAGDRLRPRSPPKASPSSPARGWPRWSALPRTRPSRPRLAMAACLTPTRSSSRPAGGPTPPTSAWRRSGCSPESPWLLILGYAPRDHRRLALRRRRRQRARAADPHGQVPGPGRRRRHPAHPATGSGLARLRSARDVHRSPGCRGRADRESGAREVRRHSRRAHATGGVAGAYVLGNGIDGTCRSSSTSAAGPRRRHLHRSRRSGAPACGHRRDRRRGIDGRPLARRTLLPDRQRSLATPSRGVRVVKLSDLAATRDALHAVCEHVLAAALYAESKHIGLRVVSGGFATPPFGPDGAYHARPRPPHRHGQWGQPLRPYPSCERQGRSWGSNRARRHGLYARDPVGTGCSAEGRFEAASTIIDWYVNVSGALVGIRAGCVADALARASGRGDPPEDCNFGGLAGDATFAEPYVYVGPPSAPARTRSSPGLLARPAPGPKRRRRLIAVFFAEGARRAAEIRARRRVTAPPRAD